MPRSHGRIMAAIWSDPDFIAMRGGAQRMFMFLLSQSDLSHAGLLPMRVNRWAKKAEDTTAATIRAELTYLAERGFVVLDEDTEEVLVRTMVRNDGVYKQPKVMLRLREDAKQIESPLLRAAFKVELNRLPLHELTTARQAVEDIVRDLRQDFAEDGYPSGYPTGRVSDTPNHPEGWETDVSAGQNPSERVSDTQPDTPRVRAGALPQPPSPIPQPPTTVPTSSGDAEAPRALAVVASAELDQPATTQTLVGEWIDHCPKRPPGNVVGQVSKHLKSLMDEGFTPDELRRALAEWNRKGLHPSTLPSVLHEVSNRGATKGRNQQATDDIFAGALARAAQKDGTSS